ncbi:DUF3305 domain-containing protein [Dinoroseobacter sp. PD6]|uniref:DUF3305 domain-containing protein n=1 Tax=Dinoroseobacter sp. PD6 TaxID=3028384 RepID=UPI00237AE264|nr:DUF3305 domain-containing protein [Dinoroseobacter sp. PD6]MDD9717447.1 DUF3305 domain-containing protein [Dinoroseobacter sp. PD6]
MPREVIRVAVVGVSHPPGNKWAKRVVRPSALMAELPALDTGALMSEQGDVRTYYMGDHAVVLHSGETRHYIDNLRAMRPSLWVSCDGDEVRLVTADPYEGEAMASDPERVVEALAMPRAVAARIEAFIEAHHVHEEFHKRKRVPAKSQHDPRAPRVLSDNEKWVQTRGKAGLPPKGAG